MAFPLLAQEANVTVSSSQIAEIDQLIIINIYLPRNGADLNKKMKKNKRMQIKQT